MRKLKGQYEPPVVVSVEELMRQEEVFGMAKETLEIHLNAQSHSFPPLKLGIKTNVDYYTLLNDPESLLPVFRGASC